MFFPASISKGPKAGVVETAAFRLLDSSIETCHRALTCLLLVQEQALTCLLLVHQQGPNMSSVGAPKRALTCILLV